MRPPRRQTASAIPGGAPANPDARQPRGQRHRHRHLLQQLQQHKVAGSEASRRAAEPPRTRATQHPASGSQLRVRKTLPRLARVTRRSGAAAQPPETATTASIRARDLAANSRGFLNQPNAAGGRKNRGSGLVRAGPLLVCGCGCGVARSGGARGGGSAALIPSPGFLGCPPRSVD